MKALKVFNSFSPIELNALPNSVLAVHPWERVSKDYAFLSSLEVTKALGEVGLYPYLVQQAGTRIESKDGYTKHLMRFRSSTIKPLTGNVYPEVVLINAHDRASSFMVELGLFRCACLNGLMVSLGNWGKYRIRHVASSISDVLVAAEAVVDMFPMIEERVSRMQQTMLTWAQYSAFAEQAMSLRWEAGKMPFEAHNVLRVRRTEDNATDLWTVFNVIQENLLKGQRNIMRQSRYGAPQRASREVKSLDMQMSLNHGLWELAESYVNV